MSTQSYHFKLGAFECMVIKDGSYAYPHPAQIFFVNAPKEPLKQVLHEHDLDPEQWQEYVSPYPSLLINTGQHLVLVDTGAGEMAPTTGNLMSNLQTEGIAPEDIDIVILTHGHADHIGGNVDSEGKPAFPNARYVMWKTEWEFWTQEPDLSSMQADEQIKQLLLTFARNKLPPIKDQLDLLEEEAEIVPGIHAVAASGHTPGHMAVAVSSGGEQLLCIADAALLTIHLEQPDWYSIFDLAPEQALSSKRQLMDRIAAEHILVQASHFPFPGLGYLTRKEDKWQWQSIKVAN